MLWQIYCSVIQAGFTHLESPNARQMVCQVSNRYTATHILRAEIPVSSVPTPKLLRNLDARPRLLISIVISALVFIPPWSGCVGQPASLSPGTRVICFLALAWSMMSRATTQKMRRARAQDEGRLAVLTLLLATDCTSLWLLVSCSKIIKGSCHYTDATRNAFWCDSYLFLVAHAHDVRSALRTHYYRDYSETTSEGTGA